MNTPHYSTAGFGSSISETLDIVERGLRRLGIAPGSIPRRFDGMVSHVEHSYRPRIPSDKVADMARLAKQGKGQSDIARELGCSQASVSKKLRLHGFKFRRGRCPKGEIVVFRQPRQQRRIGGETA